MTAFLAILGLVVGSFLNVVILRLHAGKDFVHGRSECPKCGHMLAWYENIPLISWIGLRGRCKHCKKPISLQYPLVELLTAVIFVLVGRHIGTDSAYLVATLLLWLYIAASLIILAVYDLRWYLLPDKVLLPIIVPALAVAALAAVHTHHWGPLLHVAEAGLVFGGAFYAVAAASAGRWMGGGDIKLAFVMGLLLGMQKTTLAMFLAFDAAAVIGVGLILVGRKGRKDYLPFGPFLIGGTLVAYLWGSSILHWYGQVSGLNL